jgi:hypothetical protein
MRSWAGSRAVRHGLIASSTLVLTVAFMLVGLYIGGLLSSRRSSKADSARHEGGNGGNEEHDGITVVPHTLVDDDVGPIPGEIMGDALIREIYQRGLDFDLWQLTDAQRLQLEQVVNSLDPDEQVDSVMTKISQDLKNRHRYMADLEQKLDGEGVNEDSVLSVRDLYEPLLTLGGPRALLERAEAAISIYGVAHNCPFLWVDYVSQCVKSCLMGSSADVRAMPLLRRLFKLARLHGQLYVPIVQSDCHASISMFEPLGALLAFELSQHYCGDDGDHFDDYLAAMLRHHLALRLLALRLPSLSALPASETAHLPVGLVRRLLAPTLPPNASMSTILCSVDLEAIMRQLALSLQGCLERIPRPMDRFRSALAARRAISLLPTAESLTFAYSREMRRLLQGDVADHRSLQSSTRPPRPVHNSNAICYAAATAQCLATFFPLFEQQLSLYTAQPDALIADLDTETGWFLQNLRGLNDSLGGLYNATGAEFEHLPSTGQASELLREWMNAVYMEGHMPFVTTTAYYHHNAINDREREEGKGMMSNCIEGLSSPLACIEFCGPPDVGDVAYSIPLVLDNVSDAWRFLGPLQPAKNRMRLRAFTKGGKGHAVAYVSRPNPHIDVDKDKDKDDVGSWWLCDDADIQPLPAGILPLLQAEPGAVYVLYYLIDDA